MAVTSKANARWAGALTSGEGSTALASGNGEFAVNWKARAEGEQGTTTPEELLAAAAHASCFSMALSFALENNGTPPTSIEVSAEVTFVPGTGITTSVLTVTGAVPGIDQEQFEAFAADAKANCPVSQALAGVEISLAGATLSE